VTPLPDAPRSPDGPRIVLDRSVRSFDDGSVLIGGVPGRMITLSPSGVLSLAELLDDGPHTPAGHRLEKRLVEAGMAHPCPPRTDLGPDSELGVTIVVPAHDRLASLERCLDALGQETRVVVVDDASADPSGVAEVCARHGAQLITRARNGGPGAARNDAIAAIATDLVAFVDSDCTVTPGWLRGLVWLFDDPDIGAVAPRVRPDRSEPPSPTSVLARFSEDHSALDMGPVPGEVGPERAIRYLPAAALVIRSTALAEVFDTRLRVGEDVDLVWRLLDEGWRIRYEPSVTVHHREPESWPRLLGRRFRYGTSAGPLAVRHPDRLAPVELRPWPAASVVAALTGHPWFSAGLVAAPAASLARRLHRRGIPVSLPLRWSAEGAGWTLVGVGHAATTLGSPLLMAGALRNRRWAAIASLLVILPPAVDWWKRRPDLDPLRWIGASVLDDLAYGAGVWVGCVRARSYRPLLPAIHWASTG
jgi:mycofactocin system glycosyltransferase